MAILDTILLFSGKLVVFLLAVLVCALLSSVIVSILRIAIGKTISRDLARILARKMALEYRIGPGTNLEDLLDEYFSRGVIKK